MKYTNRYKLPDSIVQAVVNDPYSKGEADFSATEILKPPQIGHLTRKHADELESDVSDHVWRLLGKGVHNILEQNHTGEGVVLEERYFADIEIPHPTDGMKKYTLSGAFDVQDGTLIQDYKVTATYTVQRGGSGDWENQLNIYDWLAWKNGKEFESLEIVAIMRDWKKSQQNKANYPESPIVIVPINRWTRARQEDFIVERILLHIQDEPQPCSKGEIWGGVRCRDWCDVANFCPQYNP